MDEKLTKEFLSKLYDESSARAKKIGELLGMSHKEIKYLNLIMARKIGGISNSQSEAEYPT